MECGLSRDGGADNIHVALLTGGGDRPYASGLATALMSRGIRLDLIGSDELDSPDFHDKPEVNFLNLRGSQQPGASLPEKVLRLLRYYARLVRYAAVAKPKVFHILWNNKFESFDRTLLMLYYRLLRKTIVLTVHNVNAGRRDSRDSLLNRLTLRIQYRLVHHFFVHTEKMKRELLDEFGVRAPQVTVIPFGINNSVPNTHLTSHEAKERMGLGNRERIILFFGNIAPYKGLEYLLVAFREAAARNDAYRLIIAGRPKNCEHYWKMIGRTIRDGMEHGRILLHAGFIPDDEVEVYFKAADVLVVPYRHIYQSGVLFLGYSFGLPVLAADVGSLKDEVVEGETGFVFEPENWASLEQAIDRYFASDLYKGLSGRRREIRDYAAKRHSWDVVGAATVGVYAGLLQRSGRTTGAGEPVAITSRDVRVPEGAASDQRFSN